MSTPLLGQIAKGLGTVGQVISNPSSLLSGAAYEVSHGKIGTDLTPGYSALNTTRTQANNLFSSQPAPSTPTQAQKLPSSFADAQLIPGGSGTYNGGSDTSGGGTLSAADQQALQNTLYGIDSGISQANDGLGRLSGQAATGNANIDKQYQDAYNRLLGTQQIGDRNYTQNRDSQLNEYGAKTSQNNTDAANFLLSARRTLGSQGAGGGSAARYALPFDAQTQAATKNSAAQSNLSHNIIALDQGHQDDLNKIKNSEADLQTQRDQGHQDYQTKINQQEADLRNQIAQLSGQKVIANGGNWQAAQAAASPYTARIQQLLSANDALAATPAIHEQAVQLNAPSLSGYNWAQPTATPVAPQDPTLAGPAPIYTDPSQDQGANPLLAMFGIDPSKQQQYA